MPTSFGMPTLGRKGRSNGGREGGRERFGLDTKRQGGVDGGAAVGLHLTGEMEVGMEHHWSSTHKDGLPPGTLQTLQM